MTRQQGVAAPSVDRAHPAQVPVELTAGDEVGQGELLERRGAAVGDDSPVSAAGMKLSAGLPVNGRFRWCAGRGVVLLSVRKVGMGH